MTNGVAVKASAWSVLLLSYSLALLWCAISRGPRPFHKYPHSSIAAIPSGMSPYSGVAAVWAALPSAVSLLWPGSGFRSTSIRCILTLAWQWLWQQALPSRVSLLWCGSSLGGTYLRRVPTLAALPSEGNHSFCAESTQLNSCSLLQYRVPYTSLVSNFGVHCFVLFFFSWFSMPEG